MKYVETTLATGLYKKTSWLKKAIMNFLLFIFPKANPDFEHLYESVNLWWLELDEKEVPQKELGFDKEGNTIVAAPIGENYGFWTDSTEPVIDLSLSPIEQIEFLNKWNAFTLKYENQDKTT